MKTPIWNKADAKRAEKMGWKLMQPNSCITKNRVPIKTFIMRADTRFKSDDEAIEWVLLAFEEPFIHFKGSGGFPKPWHPFHDTIRKALFLCAKE